MSIPAWQLAPVVEEDPSAASLQQPPMDDIQGASAPVQTENNAPAWMQAPVVETPVKPDGPLTRAAKLIEVAAPIAAPTATGVAETAAQIVTGLPAAAAGTVAGTVEAIKEGDINKFPEEFHRVADKYTYQPRTTPGKKLSSAVAYPFAKAEEFGGKVGEAVLDATDDPRAATVVHTAVAGVPYVAGYALGARGRRAGDEPTRTAKAPRVEPEWSKAEVIDQTKAVAEPRGDVLDRLPGQPAKPATASTVDYAERARATPRDETGLEIAAKEIGDPVDVKLSGNRSTQGVILDKQPTDSAINPFIYRVRLADGTDMANIRHDAVHPTSDLIKARQALENELHPGRMDNAETASPEMIQRTKTPMGKTSEAVAESMPGTRSVGAMEAETITPQTRLGDAIDATMAPLKKAGKEIADVTGGKAISYLDDLAKVSPTAKKLRNAMEYTEFSKEPIGPSFYERTSLKTGEYVSRLENTLDTLRGSFRRKLPEDINAKLAAAMRGEKGTGISGETVLRLRGLLNDVRHYAKAQGLEVGFIKDYFPRVYKQRVLESDAGRTAFIKVLQKHGIEATEADVIAARIVNHDGIMLMERGPASERINPMKPQESKPFELGRMLKQKARTDKNLETARTLARIPNKELAPFLEDNVPAVLTRYITHAVSRAEYARSFGAGEGRLNRMVRDIITEAAQAGRPVRPAEIQRIYDLADAMQKKYRPIMSSTGRAANTFLIGYQYLRTLPLATISSLSEPFLVVARGRPSAIPQAIARSLNHAVRETVRSVYRKFPKAEATKALEDVGLGLDAALSERLTASFGGEVTKFTTAFFKLNFLHQFTRFNRVLANEAGKLMVVRNLKDLKRGVPERRASQLRRELAELGVDTDKGLSWIERGAKQSDPFYDTVKAAGLRFTNEVVMNPRPTNRPMWHSNPHFHLLAQLKGFQTVFGNTVLPRWHHMITKRGAYEGTKNAAKIATAGVLMTYTAILGNELREVIKHGPGGNPKFKDEDPTKTVYRAMERAGFLGVFQFASDAMFAHRFGSPAISQLLGPQASQANELIEGAGQAMEGKPRKLARGVVNAIPGVNVIPSVRKDLTDAMAGEPERRGRNR
jgi:hypothetical protein